MSTMTTDINERVLAAFQVEHKEHLEVIRTLLVDAERGDAAVSQSRLEEAFRLAHSLKGGARVCDLKPIETLGHRLETLFSRIRQSQASLQPAVIQVIKGALDAIEDWMAALAAQQSPAPPESAIAAIEHILEGAPHTPEPTTAAAPDPANIITRLRAAFQTEYGAYVAGIRELVDKLEGAGETLDSGDLDEAFRMAHSLQGAAGAAEVESVEELGQRLESLFSQIKKESLEIDGELAQVIRDVLDAVETEMQTLSAPSAAPRPAPAGAAVEPLADARPGTATATTPTATAEEPAPTPAAAMQQVEMVRVSTQSLDRLLRSSGQLHAESLRQDQVARELNQLSRQIDDMQRQRDAIRKTAAASLHRLAALPEFNRIARYIEDLERDVRTLARTARRVRLLQKRSAWLLSSLGQQVQQDVRRARMAPAESVFQGFRKMVRDLARDDGKQVEFTVSGFDAQADRMVLQALKDPLMHTLRNAIIHGIERPDERRRLGKDEVGRIELRIETIGSRLQIVVDDDGRGIDLSAVAELAVRRGLVSPAEVAERPAELMRLIFQPGFTTSKVVTELSGRGMGLSVVHECAARLQGEVRIQPKPTPGACIVISVPLSISTHRLLLVSCNEQTFAVPVHAIQRLIRLKVSDVETVEGRPVVQFQRDFVPLVSLAHLLGIGEPELNVAGGVLHVAIVTLAGRQVAVSVDAFLAERDALVQELDGPAAAINKFGGGILLEDGRVALVLNPAELIESMKSSRPAAAIKTLEAKPVDKLPTVLVVDDSFTTRTLEKSLLEAQGFRVHVAVDGIEALSKLQNEEVDLVITDIQMPRMDGFGLLEAMKKDSRLTSLPVILVTSLDRREDQERGLSLGADAYIVKRKFDHQDLLNTINQII